MLRNPAQFTLALCLGLLASSWAVSALATGARLFKSGPIQTDTNGIVWVANRDHDSVTRLDVSMLDPGTGMGASVAEYPLPDPGDAHSPRGLAVSEDGSTVWVACHDSDRVYVLDGSDGSLIQRIDLPWGSGPYSVALSRPVPSPTGSPQEWALVTLHRGEGIAVLDALNPSLFKVLEPSYQSPLAIAWMEDGENAWVTHLFADGEHPRLSRVNFADPLDPKYVTRRRVLPTHPQTAWDITDRDGDEANVSRDELPEGGYILTRGHVAQIPNGVDNSRLWMTVQYQNIHSDHVTPDTVVQATIRKVDGPIRHVPDSNNNLDKIVLTAPAIHQVVDRGAYQGAGWDAAVAGPVDIGFTTDGAMSYVLFENSENLLEVPTGTTNVKPPAAPALRAVDVGGRPMGFAMSPVSDYGFVANIVDRTVSVIDLSAMSEVARVPITTGADPVVPALLNGERIFHTSNDPRISSNRKVSCASCHLNAEHDGRNWDLQWVSTTGNGQQPPGGSAQGVQPTATGPGTRNTQTLLGLALSFGAGGQDGNGFGQLHHSGDRDEVQDFEHTFRSSQMGGTGLVPDPQLQPPLGAPLAGLDPTGDLDDMAAYVLGLAPIMRSPARLSDGSLSESAIRGATFFMGSDPTKPADSSCASCHDPTTNFTDLLFHDVGSRRGGNENELNNRTNPTLNWHVNTPSLVGVWLTTPYEGVSTWAETLLDVVIDSQIQTGRPGGNTHGDTSGLTNRQLRDLAEFLTSIDGNMGAGEVLNARDTSPPRIVRVEPSSLTRVSVWFNESVDPLSSANLANWRVSQVGGGDVTVTAATHDPQNGDRVDLTLDALVNGCDPITYEVAPIGPILDIADSATNGVASAIDVMDPSNTRQFVIDDSITVTLGWSGYENIQADVHDTSTIGTLRTWSHGSIWLKNYNNNATGTSTGFLRLDWPTPFSAETGVTQGLDILDASYEVPPRFGDSQGIDVHRMLVSWDDMRGNDFDQGPNGNPTWNRRIHNTTPWNGLNASASTPGNDGSDPAHYNATDDIAVPPDFAAIMPAINEPFVIAGSSVTDAFRFWLENPSLNYGYGLKLQPGEWNEAKFHNSEWTLKLNAPIARITYALPQPSFAPPGEVSGWGAAEQLRVTKDPAGVLLSFEDLGLPAPRYNVYEGAIGTYYSHTELACHADPPVNGPRRDLALAPSAGSRYYLVTAAGVDVEGPSGLDSMSGDRDLAQPPTCGPFGCP